MSELTFRHFVGGADYNKKNISVYNDLNHKLTGNKNAAKSADDKAMSFIHARCKTEDKSAWVKAAQSKNLKLTEWIVKTLNDGV